MGAVAQCIFCGFSSCLHRREGGCSGILVLVDVHCGFFAVVNWSLQGVNMVSIFPCSHVGRHLGVHGDLGGVFIMVCIRLLSRTANRYFFLSFVFEMAYRSSFASVFAFSACEDTSSSRLLRLRRKRLWRSTLCIRCRRMRLLLLCFACGTSAAGVLVWSVVGNSRLPSSVSPSCLWVASTTEEFTSTVYLSSLGGTA